MSWFAQNHPSKIGSRGPRLATLGELAASRPRQVPKPPPGHATMQGPDGNGGMTYRHVPHEHVAMLALMPGFTVHHHGR